MAPRKPAKLHEASDDTRQRLLAAGLSVFSQHNYESATTRMIAEQAGVNLAAIPYHFGGKEGLYRATIQSIVDQFRAQILPTVQQLRLTAELQQLSQTEAIDCLCQFLSHFIAEIVAFNAPRSWLRLGFSDDNAPIQAFDVIYEGIICPIHDAVGLLVGGILNLPPQSAEVILRTHALMGQVIAFHLSREAVLKRLSQTDLTPDDVRLIQVIIEDHVRAIFTGSSRLKGVHS